MIDLEAIEKPVEACAKTIREYNYTECGSRHADLIRAHNAVRKLKR